MQRQLVFECLEQCAEMRLAYWYGVGDVVVSPSGDERAIHAKLGLRDAIFIFLRQKVVNIKIAASNICTKFLNFFVEMQGHFILGVFRKNFLPKFSAVRWSFLFRDAPGHDAFGITEGKIGVGQYSKIDALDRDVILRKSDARNEGRIDIRKPVNVVSRFNGFAFNRISVIISKFKIHLAERKDQSIGVNTAFSDDFLGRKCTGFWTKASDRRRSNYFSTNNGPFSRVVESFTFRFIAMKIGRMRAAVNTRVKVGGFVPRHVLLSNICSMWRDLLARYNLAVNHGKVRITG